MSIPPKINIDLGICRGMGDVIRQAIAKGITKGRMSQFTGIPRGDFDEYEKDLRCMGVDRARSLAGLLGVDPELLADIAAREAKIRDQQR